MSVKAYSSKTTSTVHLVGDFPHPRTTGRTQCGQPLENMTLLTTYNYNNIKRNSWHRICLKCNGLAFG